MNEVRRCSNCGLKLWSLEKELCLCCQKDLGLTEGDHTPPQEVEEFSSPEVKEVTPPISYSNPPAHILKEREDNSLYAVEKAHIIKILNKHKGCKAKASVELGIAVKTIYNKLSLYGLHIPEVRS